MNRKWLLLILTIPTWAILMQRGYFPIHDDLQTMRQLQMDKCVADGQIPCRWINDMGYGYGFPLFNFYPPLPYMVGELFTQTGFDYITTAKIIGIIGFALTAVGMYLLGREFLGEKGGIAAAVFYSYVPYHAVNFYVRAAVNEFWAGIFYPFILWTSYKLIIAPRKLWMGGLALSLAGLLLSHNQMMMIFAPVFMAWLGFWWLRNRSLKTLLLTTLSGVWGLGIAAFYTLPVIFEQKFVHVETLVQGYFNYLAHFLDLTQLFLRINWDYGSSVLGPGDTMSFAVGYLHWIVPLGVILVFWMTSRLKNYRSLIVMLALSGLWALFMTHSKSTPLWKLVPPLEFLQFPWRFLTLVVFLASFLAAFSIKIAPRLVLAILLTAVILINGNYFQPRTWYPDATDSEKFTGHNWYLLTTNGIFDYLPKSAPFPPADPPGANLSISGGEGTWETIYKKTNHQAYHVTISSDTAVAQIETYYFPGWKVWVDGQEQKLDSSRDPLLGRMQIDLTRGDHTIDARLTNTPVRSIGNYSSLIALGAVIILGLNRLRYHA